jgi:hypothetical protein
VTVVFNALKAGLLKKIKIKINKKNEMNCFSKNKFIA